MCGRKASGKSCYLDVDNLLAATVDYVFAVGDEGVGIDAAQQVGVDALVDE